MKRIINTKICMKQCIKSKNCKANLFKSHCVMFCNEFKIYYNNSEIVESNKFNFKLFIGIINISKLIYYTEIVKSVLYEK